MGGTDNRKDRDAIFEFYILEAHRKFDKECFSGLKEQSGAIWIECQTNYKLLSSMLFQCSRHIIRDRILFEDQFPTSIVLPGIVFSKQVTKDNEREDVLEFILIQNDVVVATGGIMLNYNEPFGELYMEVNEGYRNKDLGAFMVQELKRACYGMGRVPAARCNIDNKVSKATMLHVGKKICGFIVKGKLKF